MFKDIDNKIKGLAVAICSMGTIAAVICALEFHNITIAVLGFLGSWVSTFVLYGFGELISCTMDLNGRMIDLIEKIDDLTKEVEAIRSNTFE